MIGNKSLCNNKRLLIFFLYIQQNYVASCNNKEYWCQLSWNYESAILLRFLNLKEYTIRPRVIFASPTRCAASLRRAARRAFRRKCRFKRRYTRAHPPDGREASFIRRSLTKRGWIGSHKRTRDTWRDTSARRRRRRGEGKAKEGEGEAYGDGGEGSCEEEFCVLLGQEFCVMQMQIVTSYTRAACRRASARVVTRFRFTPYASRDTHTNYTRRRPKKNTRAYLALLSWITLVNIHF